MILLERIWAAQIHGPSLRLDTDQGLQSGYPLYGRFTTASRMKVQEWIDLLSSFHELPGPEENVRWGSAHRILVGDFYCPEQVVRLLVLRRLNVPLPIACAFSSTRPNLANRHPLTASV